MTTYRSRSARDAGFTLIEILVVIAIIGLLAGMTTTVMVSARHSVRNAVVSTQMAQLSLALDDYKNKYGEYPPDFSDRLAVERHIKKRWPRYNVDYKTFVQHIECGCKLSSSYYADILGDLSGQGINANVETNIESLDGGHVWDFDPDDANNNNNSVYSYCGAKHFAALVFWLGGLPDKDGKPSGFYANPKAPLGFSADGNPLRYPLKAQREKPLFDFELKNIAGLSYNESGQNERLLYPVDDASVLTKYGASYYVPAFVQGDFPIVYFRPSSNVSYAGKSALYKPDAGSSEYSAAVPYARAADDWYEAKRFQLIHPGVDGLFGPDEDEGGSDEDEDKTRFANDGGILHPTTKPRNNFLYDEDLDNVANFATSSTIESECEDE